MKLRILCTGIILMIPCFSFTALSQGDAKEEKSDPLKLRAQILLLDYGLGSLYNGGFMGIHSGIRLESYLLKGKLIPEIIYKRGWLDIEKLTYKYDEMKPFSEMKIGVRFGMSEAGKASWRNLRCIDRTERSGNIITTYYEQEKVTGVLHFGFAGGLYFSRGFAGNPFTEESQMEGSIFTSSQSVYGGIAITKMKNNEIKRYSSGNECRWDKYTQYYIHALYSVHHTLGDVYYYGGSSSPIDGSTTFPAIPSKREYLRDFRPFGLVVGFEDGRMRRGFIGNYEAGFIPGLKGNGFYFKAGANIAIGM
ncbi:MAG: hypothetical protein K1X56_07100 [Flavobacteriales bacterium]|nr:hypothetical protein [Flavobacteriales bacterium]